MLCSEMDLKGGILGGWVPPQCFCVIQEVFTSGIYNFKTRLALFRGPSKHGYEPHTKWNDAPSTLQETESKFAPRNKMNFLLKPSLFSEANSFGFRECI